MALAVLGALVVRAPLGSCNLHTTSQFAGSVERFDEHLAACGGVDRGAIWASYGLDVAYAAAYGVLLRHILRRTWRGWRVKRLVQLEHVVPALPLAAALFDVAEGAATLLALDTSARQPTFRSDALAQLVTGAAWSKWLLLAITVVAVGTSSVSTFFNARRARSAVPVPDVAVTGSVPLGACCSGGGIRAAAYTLGVLRALDDRRILDEVDVVTAVSGGAYTAGAYVAGRLPDPADVQPGAGYVAPSDAVGLADLEAHLSGGAHRFLSSAHGGLARSALWVLAVVAGNVALISMAVVAVGWPVGYALGSWLFHDRDGSHTFELVRSSTGWADIAYVAPSHWLPGVALVVAGAVLVVLSAAFRRQRVRQVLTAGAVVAALGAVLLVGLVVVPLFVETCWWLLSGRVEVPVLFGISVASIGGIAWRFAQKPLVKLAPRLGGVLLGLLVAVAVAAVAVVGALRSADAGWRWSPWAWLGVSAVLAWVYLAVDLSGMSARVMYRDRLRSAFSVKKAGGAVVPREAGEHPTWEQPHPARPELVICAAAQRNGPGNNGIPAESFTISSQRVTLGPLAVPTSHYLGTFHERLADDRTISSWQATTGAAFSSAMGRFRFGTTNALLAALNIDLGSWFPNPARVHEGWTEFPKVRAGYLVKEVFGLYDPNDEFVFVADGGQWENLGLVELLRRRCEVIVCIDASGDQAGAYTTLREAVALASTELDVQVDLAFLKALKGEEGGVPPSTVGTTTITYARPGSGEQPTGLLLYAKAQVAADLSLDLRRFAACDGTFPRYSTADQLLEKQQFDALVQLGRESGARLLEHIDWLRATTAATGRDGGAGG